MIRPVLALSFVVALPLLAGAQDTWVEIRFHRVHLKNGNFIDGDLVRQTDRDVTLKVKVGELTLRNDLIARTETGSLHIELMKIRGIKEKPAVLKPPEPQKRPAIDTPVEPAPRTAPVRPPVRTAKSMTGNADVDRILMRIKDSDPERRLEIMDQFVPLGETAAQALADSFETLDEETRGHAASALIRLGLKNALPSIKKALSSGNSSVRTYAASVLGSLGGPEDAPDLYPLLQDPDSMARTSAVAALDRLGDADAFSRVAPLCQDEDAGVRSQAIDSLFAMANRSQREDRLSTILETALERTRGEVKSDIIRAVGRTGRREMIPYLERHLTDDDPAVRAQVVITLMTLDAKEIEGTLLDRFALERDEQPRRQLAFAAEKFRIKRAVPHLIDWLEGDDQKPYKEAVVRALRQLTGQRLPQDHAAWAEWWERAKPTQ